MDYNTQRPDLVIPEYGRNIHIMVQHAASLENREERNTCAKAIIKVMGQLNPHLRDVEEFKPKLWAHLFIMSDFKLDVDSPYPIPTRETFQDAPKRVPYPERSYRYKHYGRTCQLMIDEAVKMEEGDKKQEFCLIIVNMMKKAYLTYNRDSVTDELILKNLSDMSDGKLTLDESRQKRIIDSASIARPKGQQKYGKKKGGKKKKKRN